MNNRIVGEFEEQVSGHKQFRGSQAALDTAGSGQEEETYLQAAYQRAIAVGRKRVFSGQGQRRGDVSEYNESRGDEQPSAGSKMEPMLAYNNNETMEEAEGAGRQSPRDRVAGWHGSLDRDVGAETASNGGAHPQIVSVNDLKYQLDLDELKHGRNSQFENRYIQRKHTGASVGHTSQTERVGEVDQSELGAHCLADGSRADASRRFLKEEERQGAGERAELVQRETDECADLMKEKDGAGRSTGSGPKHLLAGDESRSDVKAEDLPRQDHRVAMPVTKSRRPSTRFGAESTGYCEPTIEKAVQCIQILPPERPKPQYVYVTDHKGRLIEIEQGHLDSLRATTPAAAAKGAAKSGTARADSRIAYSIDDRKVDDEDDHSQNETKSQITQFTDNTGTNNPSQQFQMNQVRAFQNMNTELYSQPNMSDKSPPAGATGQTAERGGSYHQKRGSTAYHNQDAEQSLAPIANTGIAPRATESQEPTSMPNIEEIYESRAMPLEHHLKKLKSSTASAAGRSRLAANKLSELIDADHEAREESTYADAQNERPWLTFNNNVFDIVAKKEAREKQRTTSFTQSQKSCEMQSSGLYKEATIASRLKKQPINQGTVPSSGVTRSKKGADLINVERFGVLANTRPKSSQIGRGGTTGQPRSKMVAVQRNNMKSTREDSEAYPQARGSLLRSANQLSSAGASGRSPLDPGMDSANGSALLRKRREQGLAGNSSSNPRKPVPSYNQSAQPQVLRKLGQAQSTTVVEAPYPPAEQAETRIRAAYKGQYGHFAGRSHSRKADQGDNLANPSIIPQDQARRASMTRHQSSQVVGGSRERCRETDDDNSNYGTIEKAPQDAKPPTMSEEDMRKEMVAAFQKIRLDVYSDILRIKKPQTQAFVAAQLLCRLVCAFRGGAQRQVTDTKFPDWNQIQEFVHKKPNVIKFNQEITQLIQHMILSKDYLLQVKSEQLKNHLSKMAKIQLQYFADKTKSQVLRQFQTNKNFSTIVNLCYCIVRYVLFQAGKGHLLNLTVEPTVYGSQSSTSSLRRAEAGSQGERSSSLNSGHSAPGQRSSSKPTFSAKNSIAGSNLNRAGSGRILGTRGKNQVLAQSRNGHNAFVSSAEAHSTGATAPSGSYHQPGRGVARKRSPRLPQKELFQATINRLSTPKQHQGTSKSQTAGASALATAQAAMQKSAEQPRKRAAYMRPEEYEDEVHRRLCQATLDHMSNMNAGGSSWTPAAPGRQTVKSRATAQPQRSSLSRSQRPAGGAGRDKYSTASRKKVNEPSHGSQHARTPAKGEDRTHVSKTRPYLEQMSRSYLQRRASPHEAYQQPKDPQPADLKANYQSRGDDLTSSSVQNSWVQLVTGQAQSDLAGSNGHLAASASKQAAFQHQRLQPDCAGLQASTPNEKDSDARGSSPQFSQKKSRKLYEILLQQQRRKSNSKYEKLTLSSVSKKKKGGNPATEFSGRKGTAPLVQTFAVASGTPGLASTLYNSNVFSTQKSRQGKENHMVAKMDEQNSESKARKHEALVATLAGRVQRADTITKEPGRSLLSPHQSKAAAEKSFLLHRPSASSIRSPKALLHARSKRGQNATAASAKNNMRSIEANHEVNINNGPPASDLVAVQPESTVAEPPAPSSQQKTRKTRLERSQSKSGNRRDRHHRRRAAGDLQDGNHNKQADTPDRERNFAQEYFNNAAAGGRDEQLRQFLEIENKCGSFHQDFSQEEIANITIEQEAPRVYYDEQEEPKVIEGTEPSDARPSQTVSAVTTQREEMLQSGSPSQILLIGQEEKISSGGASPQLGGEEGQNLLLDAAGDESDQVRHVSVVEDRDLARAESSQQADQQDDSGVSRMSSILQQIQSEAPHPASQPAQPDDHSSFAPQEDIADGAPSDEVPEGARRHTDTSIFVEEQAKEGSPIPSRASPSCNVPEGKSPLNFKRECKDSDDLSVLSGVGAPLDAGEGPAMVPQSTSRESGRISELPESRSEESGEAKKEELGLDSESLLSEEQNYDSAVKPVHRPSPAGVHEYKTAERSQKVAGSPGSNREDNEAYDPFEEAKRIAAMIKAECLGQILQEEQIVNADMTPSQTMVKRTLQQNLFVRKSELDDSTQERVPSRNRCSPPNELSARHLLQKERLRSGEGVPQREAAIAQSASLPEARREGNGDQVLPNQIHCQSQSILPPTTIMEQDHSHRALEQSRSDSTCTANTPYRPALAHPRRNSALSSGRRTPDTSRHDLQVQTHFVQSCSQRRPYTNEATNIVKGESCIGTHLPSEPPTAGQHFQTFLQYCDQAQAAAGHRTAKAPADLSQRLSSQESPQRSQCQLRRQRNSELETPSCARVKVDEVIGRQGEVQRVEIGEDTMASGRVVEEEGEATGSAESRGESQMSEVRDGQEERQTEQDMETQREKVRRDDVESGGQDDAYKSKSAASSGEDGYYMQEIVSPFRQLRLSALGSVGAQGYCEPDSPEVYNKQMESTKWLINPIKVQRKPINQDEEVQRSYFDVDEDEDRQIVSGRSSSPESYQVCPSQRAANPYWHPDFGSSGLNLERRVSSPVISPGKLKAQVSQSRVGIMEQILATQLEIEENSPSRVEGHHVNREMIEKLKERRLLQRSKSRDGPGGPISTGEHQAVPASDPKAGATAPKDTHDLIRDIQQRLLSRQSQK